MPFDTREQHNEYHRQYKAARRSAWLADKCCAQCGSTEDLQIDHIDPGTKGADFKNVWTWKQERREAELAKCQVLCWPHHKEKTAAEWAAKRQHGTATMYRYCKCRVCKDGHAARRRAKRAEMVSSST